MIVARMRMADDAHEDALLTYEADAKLLQAAYGRLRSAVHDRG